MEINAQTLSTYLNATLENANEHDREEPDLMNLVHRMDQIFQEEVFIPDWDLNEVSGFLAMNAYLMLLSAVRQALSGHVVPVFPIVRTALESACYAFLISQNQELALVWLNRHKSKNALNRCREKFTVNKAVDALKPYGSNISELVKSLYDAFIDYGAHPNQKAVLNHLSKMVGVDGYELTGVYPKNSWEVNRSLLVCVEAGLAIAFLLAASTDYHPLIGERVNVYQEWLNEKNRMAEELNGGPIDYSGPMYSSIIPPT